MQRTQVGKWLIAGVIAAAVFGLYLPTRSFEFIRLDDGLYVVENKMVTAGWTQSGVAWAFTNRETGNIHPLTWLSLMTDVSLFGVDPGAIHLVNAGMHAFAAVLLFVWLIQLVGGRRRVGSESGAPSATPPLWLLSAGLAALWWGVHPLRVESVAWISSRKDVLSVLFCLSGLIAYLADVRRWQYAAAPVTGTERHFLSAAGLGSCSWRWWVAFCCFILGYAAKPTMLVFPAYVAIMEWLECGRIRWKPLVLMGSLAAGFVALTMYAQEVAMMEIGWEARLLNAMVSLSVYLRQLVVPTGLSIFYPYVDVLPGRAVLLGALTVVACVGGAFYGWRRAPVVTAALAWFGAGLVPVIGLIQVGSACHADRYMYLPTLGITAGVAFGLYGVLRRVGKWPRVLVCAAVGGLCLTYVGLSSRYIRVWANNFTVFYHAVGSDPKNARAWQHLGSEYANRLADPDTGIQCYRRSLSLAPSDECGGQLALALAIRGNRGDFEEVHRLCAKLEKAADGAALDSEGGALTALGVVAMREQRWDDAAKWFGYAVQRGKTRGSVLLWYGMVLYNTGRTAEATRVLQDAAEHSSEATVRAEARMRLELLQRRSFGPLR